MRRGRLLILLVFIFTLTMFAQERVAEGSYRAEGRIQPGVPSSKTITNWTLFAAPAGGYRLSSEILNQPNHMRVLQIEELTDHLVPIALAYELYLEGEQTPTITTRCELGNAAIVCRGNSNKGDALPSNPYKVNGPFWVWMDGQNFVDGAWLLGGALNMAHPKSGPFSIKMFVVSGGTSFMIGDAVNIAKLQALNLKKPLTVVAPDRPTPWNIAEKEEETKQLMRSDTVDIAGTKVVTRGYASPRDTNLAGAVWITDSGIVTKVGVDATSSFVLADYKQ